MSCLENFLNESVKNSRYAYQRHLKKLPYNQALEGLGVNKNVYTYIKGKYSRKDIISLFLSLKCNLTVKEVTKSLLKSNESFYDSCSFIYFDVH